MREREREREGIIGNRRHDYFLVLQLSTPSLKTLVRLILKIVLHVKLVFVPLKIVF